MIDLIIQSLISALSNYFKDRKIRIVLNDRSKTIKISINNELTNVQEVYIEIKAIEDIYTKLAEKIEVIRT